VTREVKEFRPRGTSYLLISNQIPLNLWENNQYCSPCLSQQCSCLRKRDPTNLNSIYLTFSFDLNSSLKFSNCFRSLCPGGRGRLQAKHRLNHHCQCDVTFRLDEIQNGPQWVKYKRLIKMRNFAPIFCPIFLSSLICGLYYIEESLCGTFWWPKLSRGR